MVTVGRGLDVSVHEFFDGVRSYDAKRAAAVLAPDADFESPWSGPLHGKDAIEAWLKAWLSDARTRPSFTISDVDVAGAITRLKVSVSGRFGKAPELVVMHVLRVQHTVHHVRILPVEAKGKGSH